MSLFFPHEFATLVTVDDGYIVIEQYSDNTPDVPVGSVRLTEHQFMENFNRDTLVRGMLKKEAAE